jgi:Tfp pilus assembly protein PilO
VRINRENLFSFLSLHIFLVAVLAIANIVLLARLVIAWNTLRTDRPEQMALLQANLKTLELQTAPLRGLPAKVKASSDQAEKFYDKRVPANYSSISADLNELGLKNNVRVARIAYTPVPVFDNLVEVRMDASLAGEYAPIMRYINGLERDKLFYIINGLTFTGQQGGTVNVRLRVTTYIHAQDANQQAPPPNEGGPADDAASPDAALRTPAIGTPALTTGGQ